MGQKYNGLPYSIGQPKQTALPEIPQQLHVIFTDSRQQYSTITSSQRLTQNI